MKFPRFIFTLLFGMSLLFMSLQAACSGGSITATESTTYTCKVKMESRRGMDRTLPRSYKFDVEIELECLSKGKHCYQITYLSCQGEVKSNAIPINLLKAGDCPGGPYCLSKCSNASRSMWDIPSLLAIDGCNVYEYQTELKVGG
jgi:hypothetical protein